MDRKIDGVYGQALTDVFKMLAIDPAKAPSIDRNVLAWVAAKVPPDLTSFHVIDWGAGTGRFVPLFNVRGAERITLVEPSESNARVLSKLERHGLNIKKGSLGNAVTREWPPAQTLHLAVFVLNCILNPAEAIASLVKSTKPGERILVVTNVFVPSVSAAAIASGDTFAFADIQLHFPALLEGMRPAERTFDNEMIHTGAVLSDAVHLIHDIQTTLQRYSAEIVVNTAEITPPDGFRHSIRPGQDFKDFRFVVLCMDLCRTEPK